LPSGVARIENRLSDVSKRQEEMAHDLTRVLMHA
jgi:hypothetical protein